MASRDDLRILAPELATVADATLDFHLARAAERMDATEWGALYYQGALYLAAHLATVSSRGAGAGAGPVVSRQAGAVQISYGAVVGVLNDDATHATTPYGIEYLNLRRQLPPVARVC